MKKLIATVLSLAMLISLAACGNSGSNGGGAGSNPGNSGTVSSTPSGGGDKKTITLSDGTEWPTKPITILVGYSAGGNVDILCRFLAEPLSKELGVPIVIENLPGSGSWLAWNQMLNSEPDGYTFTSTNVNAVLGHYDPDNPREATIDDFELLANYSIDYNVFAIRNDETRFSDYPSLIEYAKQNQLVVAAPGSGLTSGDGTVIKYLQDEFGCNIVTIPVDGNSDALTMFIAGETDFFTGNLGDLTDAEANGYHAMVVFGEERSQFLPDVPTAIETGPGDYVAFSARGFGYPKGVDQAIVDRMVEALEICFNDPGFQANMATTGSEMHLLLGDDYRDLLVGLLDRRLEIWGVAK